MAGEQVRRGRQVNALPHGVDSGMREEAVMVAYTQPYSYTPKSSLGAGDGIDD